MVLFVGGGCLGFFCVGEFWIGCGLVEVVSLGLVVFVWFLFLFWFFV